ncbi:short chain dehydrogenase family protein [Mycobacterium kansasii]|uniref:Short chain dehydrogenase family protein n=1 Tax=Mycobacterium kansasii TaxID=1768 RepID=A0A1V3XZX3_MYCKA|nr:short chain dehydrogenase family protein [Mycobacterium kansasii]
MDLDLNLKLQPAKYRQLLQHILQHVADGNLPVLPVSEFGLRDAADAFRLMASGKHTGKIVISIPDSGSIEAVASPPPVPLVSPDGGYLIVGGMGGLGFVVARWLAEQGAGLVVLNGRSAPDDEVGRPSPSSTRRAPDRGGHRRHRRTRHGRPAGASGRRCRFPAGRGPAQRDGAGRRNRLEHDGFGRRAGVRAQGHRQLAAAPGNRFS